GAEGHDLKDPDQGGQAPRDGAYAGEGGADDAVTRRSGRKPGPDDGGPAQGQQRRDAPEGNRRTGKRRKRRRGRKVYARDTAGISTAQTSPPTGGSGEASDATKAG